MRQSVQISKLNGFRSGFMAFLVAASFGFSASSIAAGPATKPAKPDAAIGESFIFEKKDFKLAEINHIFTISTKKFLRFR